jgi:hypothetical protein
VIDGVSAGNYPFRGRMRGPERKSGYEVGEH